MTILKQNERERILFSDWLKGQKPINLATRDEKEEASAYLLIAKTVHAIHEWIIDRRPNVVRALGTPICFNRDGTAFLGKHALNPLQAEAVIVQNFRKFFDFWSSMDEGELPNVRPDVLLALVFGKDAYVMPSSDGFYKVVVDDAVVPIHGTPKDLYLRVVKHEIAHATRPTTQRIDVPTGPRQLTERVVVREIGRKAFSLSYQDLGPDWIWKERYVERVVGWGEVERKLEGSVYADECKVINETGNTLKCVLSRNPHTRNYKRK